MSKDLKIYVEQKPLPTSKKFDTEIPSSSPFVSVAITDIEYTLDSKRLYAYRVCSSDGVFKASASAPILFCEYNLYDVQMGIQEQDFEDDAVVPRYLRKLGDYAYYLVYSDDKNRINVDFYSNNKSEKVDDFAYDYLSDQVDENGNSPKIEYSYLFPEKLSNSKSDSYDYSENGGHMSYGADGSNNIYTDAENGYVFVPVEYNKATDDDYDGGNDLGEMYCKLLIFRFDKDKSKSEFVGEITVKGSKHTTVNEAAEFTAWTSTDYMGTVVNDGYVYAVGKNEMHCYSLDKLDNAVYNYVF